ncbi:zinc finger protein 85-like [Anopheles aquasalis]|uniref:zinc finger protein 85-like n=1 Tax=Anopheles aquasalis TaxID=42839 RepID=UPI00215B1AA6|nr:zinc finger protein 85-like [Anopheles aquasalis]
MDGNCRLCLNEEDAPKCTFKDNEQEQPIISDIDWKEMIQRYLQIDMLESVDDLQQPTDSPICMNCSRILVMWHRFYKMCHKNLTLYVEVLTEHDEECENFYYDLKEDNSQAAASTEDGPFEIEYDGEQVIVKGEPEEEEIDCHLTIEEVSESVVPKAKSISDKKQTESKSKGARRGNHSQRSQIRNICVICGQIRVNMEEHLRTHRNERRYKCPYCPKSFVSQSNCNSHKNIHTRAKLYKCDICDKEYPMLNGLKQHKATHQKDRTYLCSICGKSYYQPTGLARHKRTHTEERNFKCDSCDKSFFTNCDLRKHAVIHSNKKPYSCEICEKSFNRNDNLRTHMKKHSRRSEWSVHDPFVLVRESRIYSALTNKEVCLDELIEQYLSINKQSLMDDASICGICWNAIEQWHNFRESCLQNEERLKNLQTDLEKVVLVGKQYNFAIEFVEEESSLCEEKPSEEACYEDVHEVEETVQYEEVNELKVEASLVRHKLIHYEEPKIKCTECDKVFLTKTRMKKHFLVHLNEKPFNCEVCNKAFNRKDNLNVHIKTHTKPRFNFTEDPPGRTRNQEEELVYGEHESSTDGKLVMVEIELLAQLPCEESDVENAKSATVGGERKRSTTNRKERRKKRCTICGIFVINLPEHQRMHLGIRNNQCPYCPWSFVHRANLHAHLNIHTRERVFLCSECGAEFVSSQGLAQHTLIHKEREFECNVCGSRFSRKAYLRLHLENVHPVQPKLNYKCAVCDRTFVKEVMMQQHLKLHDTAVFSCGVCNRAYQLRKNLLRHMRMSHPLANETKNITKVATRA